MITAMLITLGFALYVFVWLFALCWVMDGPPWSEKKAEADNA